MQESSAARVKRPSSRARAVNSSFGDKLVRKITPYSLLTLFILLCFLTGGSSRYDVISLAPLRAGAFVILGAAFIFLNPSPWARTPFNFLFVVSLVALACAQLVPLPPALWHTLPGREIIVQMDDLAGLTGVWRPLTLSPSRTLNSLFSLAVPLLAVVLMSKMNAHGFRRIRMVLIVALVAQTALGILQVSGPIGNALYFYRITSDGAPVGFFANRNHSAVFAAMISPLVISWIHEVWSDTTRKRRLPILIAGMGLLATTLTIVLIGGSRGGLLAMIAAISASAIVILIFGRKTLVAPHKKSGKHHKGVMGVASLLGIGMLALAGAAITSSRAVGIERLFSSTMSGELRVAVLPVLFDMVEKYFPAGTGLGSFYLAYKVDEPILLLEPRYLNQAHNDPLQMAIEAGLPGLALMAIAAIWLLYAGWRSMRMPPINSRSAEDFLAAHCWIGITVCLSASWIDYALRVPSIMLLFAMLACIVEKGYLSGIDRHT